MDIRLSNEVEYILNTLIANGYEAYIVGGCVRDSLLGKDPEDWDICTPALPQQMMECFEGQHIVETGLPHGTITLVLNHTPYEITTYRIDGQYKDNRHPDKVEFVSSLKEDLARRDFTINAMAYNPKDGVVDFFNGIEDLNAGMIRCVGDANKRFQEDALRIMRALRFAAVLGFSIEHEASQAMFDNKQLLNNIAAERIAAELNKLIVGDDIQGVLSKHMPVIAEIIPELTPTIGVDAAPKDVQIRLAMLFCDIAKPKEILLRLKYDKNTVDIVTELILHHDADIEPNRKHIKRWLNKIGEKRFRQLIEVKIADAMAQAEDCRHKKLSRLNDILILLDEIIEQQQCFSLNDLAVNGRDLIAVGVPEGIQVGTILNRLMNMVIDEEVENDKVQLLNIAHNLIEETHLTSLE